MSRKYRKLDDWKNELVGKTFAFLTVLDVVSIINNKNKKRYVAVCDCKCSNRCNVDVYGILSGHNKSCGCYEKSVENSNRRKEINRNNKELRSRSRKKWCEDNPDKVKEIGRKKSEWCKNNPDKVEEQAQKYSLWCKNNPDKVIEKSQKYSQWYRSDTERAKELSIRQHQWLNDPDKVKAAQEKRSITLANNPDILTNSGIKVSKWYKDHPENVLEQVENRKNYYIRNPSKVEELSDTVKRWLRDNPENVSKLRDAHHAKFVEDRLNTNYSKLLDVIHPSQLNSLLNGEITQSDIVLTKCPVCHKYDSHRLHNVFTLSKSDFRTGVEPLCKDCVISLSSSKYEKEIADYVSTFYSGELIRNSRDVISPQELDLYYPEKKIAIEFNGDYWHSSKFKDSGYHYNKYRSCIDVGVLLVSIFESEWISKKDQIKEYLKDLFSYKDNCISFNRYGCINNNYPALKSLTCDSEYLSDSYSCNKYTVFTCGYSKII